MGFTEDVTAAWETVLNLKITEATAEIKHLEEIKAKAVRGFVSDRFDALAELLGPGDRRNRLGQHSTELRLEYNSAEKGIATQNTHIAQLEKLRTSLKNGQTLL